MKTKVKFEGNSTSSDIFWLGYWLGINSIPIPTDDYLKAFGMTNTVTTYFNLLKKFKAAIELNNTDLAETVYLDIQDMLPHTSPVKEKLLQQIHTAKGINKRYKQYEIPDNQETVNSINIPPPPAPVEPPKVQRVTDEVWSPIPKIYGDE